MAVRRIVHVLTAAFAVLAASFSDKALAQNWDGSGLIRFGVFLQGSVIDYDIKQQSVSTGNTFHQSASPHGWGVGISSGYDLRLGTFVFGVEGDVSWDDGRSKARPLTQEQYGIDYFATLRVRLGYYVHPALLVYGTTGYSLLGAEYKFAGGTIGASTGPGFKKYATLDGFVIGLGAEYDLGWGIGFVEYLHNEMGVWDFLSFRNHRLQLEGTQDVFRLGLKFKVGHDHTHDVYRGPAGR